MVKSRWAEDEDDVRLQAQQKDEKVAKKRAKAERAQLQKLQEEQAAATQLRTRNTQAQETKSDIYDEDRPAKRRRLSAESSLLDSNGNNGKANNSPPLLRFDVGGWKKCRSVEDYEKLNDIEEGAYGWVSRAKDTLTGHVVALKRLKMENPLDGIPVTGLREMQTLLACNHVNVVALREVVVGEDTNKIENIFLVLDFVEHDLRTLLDSLTEPFLQSEVKTLLHQLISGMSYLHTNWIIHRDLKTSNLLLNNRGILKIADFGMARYFSDPPPNMTQLVVTLWYRSPELILGAEKYGIEVDMWSAGCIFGELVTREPLIQGKNEVEQLLKIFELCGIPTEESWPNFRRLPNARSLRLPKNPAAQGSVLRAKFPLLTNAGSELLTNLLSLNPSKRYTAAEVLQHEYFKQDPKMKNTSMFPTFPSKAGLEKRRKKDTPDAPARGQENAFGAADFSDIFASKEGEEKGGGFALKLI